MGVPEQLALRYASEIAVVRLTQRYCTKMPPPLSKHVEAFLPAWAGGAPWKPTLKALPLQLKLGYMLLRSTPGVPCMGMGMGWLGDAA
jgi:hypothetical protein